MDEPQKELREDRIPPSKAIKKQKEKQQSLLILIIAAIVLALALGMALLLSDQRGQTTPAQTTIDPYVSLYDYLSSLQGAPSSAPAATTAPVPTAGGTVPTTGSTVPSASISIPTTAPETPAADEVSPTLPETLPEANGTMIVDNDPDNAWIQQISRDYNIPAARLTAFYSVPNTGQNYVLEWNGTTDGSGRLLRSAGTLRRCFLIDEEGKLDSVAAADPDERVNMSRVENSFAMETLIKGVILPKVLEQIDT